MVHVTARRRGGERGREGRRGRGEEGGEEREVENRAGGEEEKKIGETSAMKKRNPTTNVQHYM